MSLKYVIKKRTFGFDKTKTEKYVAQNVITNTLDFRNLCDEITKVGLVPSGAVKFVLDALIDTLNMNLNKGISVQLGDFGFGSVIAGQTGTVACFAGAHYFI